MNALQKLAEDLLRRSAIPIGVWALGGVSLLMDTSSEMIHALLPIYLVAVMGASMEAVGIIEGVAEATASIVKVVLRRAVGSPRPAQDADRRRLRPRRASPSRSSRSPARVGWVAAARFLDRVGKGIRGAPRDALIADIAPPRAARRQLRPAPGARHGRRLRRAADRHRPDGGDRRRFPRRVLGGGRSGLSRRRAARHIGQGAGSEPARRAKQRPTFDRAALHAPRRRLLAGRRRRDDVRAGALLRGVPGAAGPGPRPAAGAGAADAGDDERRLCARRLSGRRALRPARPADGRGARLLSC